MNNKVYIGNLDYAAVEADVEKLCSQFGKVYYVTIPKNHETSAGRGFCFVKFESELSADRCIAMLDGQEFMGRKLVANVARPRTSESDR